MNVIAWLEFELADYDSAVQCFNHYNRKISLDLWGTSSIPSLPLLPSLFWPGVIVDFKVQPMAQIEIINHFLNLKIFNCLEKILMLKWIISITLEYIEPFNSMPIKVFELHGNTWNHLTMAKSMSYPYLPNPSARAGYDTKSIFKRSLTGLNSEFSFS